MQTVCAHCYTLLSPSRLRRACILCTTCEQRWLQGKTPRQRRPLPEWRGPLAALPPQVSAPR